MSYKKMSIILSAVLCFGLLAGCSKNTDTASSPGASSAPTGNESSAPTPAPSAAQTTISFYSWEDQAFQAPIIAEFEKENPDIKVNYILLSEGTDSDAAMKKFDLLAASGEKMDVIKLSGITAYSKRADLKLLTPLNDMMKAENLNYDDEYLSNTSINGTYYGISDVFESKLVILNKDMLDKAGLPVPKDWTWDDFLTYAKKLTYGDGASKVYGTYFHTWPMYWELGLLNQEKDNGLINNGVLNINSPYIKKSLEIRNQAENIDKSAIPYAESISQKLAYRDVYFGKRAAMIATGNWMVGESGGSDKVPATFKTAFALFPKNAPADKSGYVDANGNILAIPSSSEHKDAAYKFIRFYSTTGKNYSIEFAAWKKQDLNQKIDTILKTVKNPEMVDKESLLYVLQNTKAAAISIPPSYQDEADTAFTTEAEKYLLKKQDLDTTVNNATIAVQKIIDMNK
jgi:multiple sugar transport system substrate-binding protein